MPKPQRPSSGDPHPELRRLIQSDPDLVDRLFDYIATVVPQMAEPARRAAAERAVRDEFGGQDRVYVRSAAAIAREDRVRRVLELFNGRNASEVARVLNISRATVYRCLKQPGSSQVPP